MSSNTTGVNDSDSDSVTVYNRGVSRIENGVPVIVEYQSNRGNKSRKTRSGVVINVQHLSDNSVKFWFYEEDTERKIEVVLRETLEGSSVKSQKSSTPSTIGSPTKVCADPTVDTVEELEQRKLLGARNNEFDVVVSVACISSNKSVLEWVNENDV